MLGCSKPGSSNHDWQHHGWQRSVRVESLVVTFAARCFQALPTFRKDPSALQGAAAMLPPPIHLPPYSAGVTRMPSPPGSPPGVPHKQHPTAVIHVAAEDPDPTFRSHTNTCGFFISLSLLFISSSAPTLLVAWDECKLDNKKASLFRFYLFWSKFFKRGSWVAPPPSSPFHLPSCPRWGLFNKLPAGSRRWW